MSRGVLSETNLGDPAFQPPKPTCSARPSPPASQCVGILDWVGGFVGGARLQVETFVTPVARYRGTKPLSRTASQLYEPLFDQAQSSLPSDLSYLSQLNIGSPYVMGDRIGPGSRPSASYGHKRHPSGKYQRRFLFTDEDSATLPFRDICHAYPRVARAIERHAPCPPSVSFYVAWHEGATIAIPCASILAHCYDVGSNRLVQFLKSPKRDRFGGSDVGFDGFQYFRASQFRQERYYWLRVQRNLQRAENELAQLLPRAVAYKMIHGSLLPILIRPPFCGNASIAGNAIVDSDAEGTVAVFTSGLSFGPTSDTRSEDRLSRRLTFAPFVSRYGVTLDAIGAELQYWRGSLDDELFEPRYFPAVSRIVKDGLQSGMVALQGQTPLTFREFLALQKWSIRRLWS